MGCGGWEMGVERYLSPASAEGASGEGAVERDGFGVGLGISHRHDEHSCNKQSEDSI